MPNMPSKIGRGVVVWKSTNLFEFNVNSVLGRLGKAIEVKNEQYIDMATAISGSGPAYVYLFEELLVSAAKSIGLPENLAQELVTETFAGAVAIQKESNPQKLREKVTSKDGTTFAAIKVFKENNLAQIFQLAVKKAYERSQKLND